MPLYELTTPAQHPVVTLVNSAGEPITSVNTTDAPAAENSVGMIQGVAVAGTAPVAWFGVNGALFHRFSMISAQAARYFLVKIGIASGNIQYGVVRLSGTGHVDYSIVMNSGIVACPAAGDKRLDLGRTVLPAGDYALFFWADNVTITIPQSTNANYAARRAGGEVTGLAGGVPATGTLTFTNRNFDGYLEADV